MLRSLPCRAQTEPIAAICAVSIFAIALGLYVTAAQPILPGFSDASTADRTIDRVWDDVEKNGLFHAHGDADAIDELVAGESIPDGLSVYVAVTAIDGGAERPVAEAGFPSGYPYDTDAADEAEFERYVEEDGVPDRASVATRSIPVALESRADVRSGTLRVVVW